VWNHTGGYSVAGDGRELNQSSISPFNVTTRLSICAKLEMAQRFDRLAQLRQCARYASTAL